MGAGLESVFIEDYTLAVARVHAALLAHTRQIGSVRGTDDLIIAATALASGRIVATSDARGFKDLPGVAVRREERDSR